METAQKTPVNPTVDPTKKDVAEKRRIPMSVPRRKLEVSDIPGYHLYWFLDQNVAAAQQAGYEFVDESEIELNQHGVGTSRDISGNADLGTLVKVVAGAGAGGRGEMLNLMKIKNEFYLADRKEIEARNAQILNSIFKDEKIMGDESVSAADKGQTYVKQALFNRPVNKKV